MTYEEAIESLRYCHSMSECEECVYYDVRGFCADMDSEISWDTILKHHDKYKWHNLRENPEDLPEAWVRVIVAYRFWNSHLSYKTARLEKRACGNVFVENGNAEFGKGMVIAWKYIEPFEGEVNE